MESRLEALARSAEIRTQPTKGIITRYHQSVARRMDEEIFQPLEALDPKLGVVFETLRKGENPIDGYDVSKAEIKKVQMLITIAGVASIFSSAEKKMRLAALDRNLTRITTLMETVLPLTEEFYHGIARSITAFAQERGVAVDEFMRSQQNLDCAVSQAHSRGAYESYVKLNLQATREFLGMIPDLMAAATYLGIEKDDCARMPSQKSLSKVCDEMELFLARESARIYATRDDVPKLVIYEPAM